MPRQDTFALLRHDQTLAIEGPGAFQNGVDLSDAAVWLPSYGR